VVSKSTSDDFGVCYMIGGGLILAAPVIVVYQSYLWLRSGVWTEFPALKIWEWCNWNTPVVGWIGVQRIVDTLIAWPLSLWVVALGFLFREKDVARGHCYLQRITSDARQLRYPSD
jgi:hypothetical protein